MQLYQKEDKMNTVIKIIIGAILGFVLTLPFQVKAYNDAYTEWEEEVINLLEQIERHVDDINSDTESIINKL